MEDLVLANLRTVLSCFLITRRVSVSRKEIDMSVVVCWKERYIHIVDVVMINVVVESWNAALF